MGLRMLAQTIRADRPDPSAVSSEIALAVGDTASDVSMLALGRSAFVPAHAGDAAMASNAVRLRSPYQAGLSLAVAELLGHRHGGCSRCDPAP
jgi:hypothetical protein